MNTTDLKDTLIQIQQRSGKLLDEVVKLEDLEFDYHTTCTVNDYTVVQDQKELVEFLLLKLNNSTKLLEIQND